MIEEKQSEAPGTQGAVVQQPLEDQAVHAAIAGRVRMDSAEKASLTSLDGLATLVPEPGRVRYYISGLTGVEAFKDVKLVIAGNGAIYLYSETSIPRKHAERLAFEEEVKAQIVARVRSDSGTLARITPVDALGASVPGAEPERVDPLLAGIVIDERYKDIKLLSDGKGRRYLYSENGMTRSYAELLASVEGDNPVDTIAATVRSDSRTYPRPTNPSVFKAPVFKINPSNIEQHIRLLLSRPEYKDIKLVTASTGAAYLYSDLYLDPDWVQTTVEWEEVGRYTNP